MVRATVRFAPILLQKSKTERLQKSRESRFSDDSNAERRRGADRQVRGGFSERRCGPSRRHVQHAPAPLKIFVRHPKKTFATKSAKSRRFSEVALCPLPTEPALVYMSAGRGRPEIAHVRTKRRR